MADPNKPKPGLPLAEDARRRSAEERRRFAKAITRAEFGRFYWDDDLERQLRTATEDRRKGGNRSPGRRR